MVYIYWPKFLLVKPDSVGNFVVIGYRKAGADIVILSLVKAEHYIRNVQKPYIKVGLLDKLGELHLDPGYYNASEAKIVEFVPPKLTLMQFFSLEPISLMLPEKINTDPFDEDPKATNFSKLLNYKEIEYNNTLRLTLDVINLYYRHLELFNNQYKEYAEHKVDLTRFWNSTKKWTKKTLAYYMLCQVILYVVMTGRLMAGNLSAMLNWKKLPLISWSVTMQQIDLRAQQLCYIPVQYMRINGRLRFCSANPRLKDDSSAPESDVQKPKPSRRISISSFQSLPCEFYPDYIRLYNTLWLIANDVSLGVTFGAFLLEKRDAISSCLHIFLRAALYIQPMRITEVLDENPFGIKLNGELSRFLSELFIWIIDLSYALFIEPLTLTSTLNSIVEIVAHCATLFGATFALALTVDVLIFLSLHISLFYIISAKLYRWQITVMKTLFYLFCGKKINILRKRIDNDTFQLDQMLMGTLIFIVLIFLFPTVFAFYLTYTLMRGLLVVIATFLESLMALLNHFPLFALLLRVKDPKRLPGGISIMLRGDHYSLENNPLKVSMMFRPYSDLMAVIADNFNLVKIIPKILVGQPIMIHRISFYQLLYSSLPIKPIEPNLLWVELKHALI